MVFYLLINLLMSRRLIMRSPDVAIGDLSVLASCAYATRPLFSWLPATEHTRVHFRLDT